MQVAQRKLNRKVARNTANGTPPRQRLDLSAVVLAGLLLSLPLSLPFSLMNSTSSYAGLNGLSLAATYPTPQGFAYQTLDHVLGAQAEAWLDSPGFMAKVFPQMHLALTYDPFFLRALTPANIGTLGIASSLGVTMVGAFVGLQAQSGEYGRSFTPFFTVDVGAVFDSMTFSGTSSSTSNAGASFAAQLVPGFDLPMVSNLGLLVELPVKIYNLNNTLTIWSAVLGLRYKL